ncbi:MAG: carboxypeptidase-like regulatory domain-containing protein [Chitinophagaceae bacterium]
MSTDSMLNRLLFLLLLPPIFATSVDAQDRHEDDIVQLTGITITADSLRVVPGTTVSVKNKYRGVISSDLGVFSIVCLKGDTLEFTSIGFRPKTYVVPRRIQGQYFSMIQLMVQDTFYLPETIVRPLPQKGEFDYAFKNWQIPDDQYELARKNTDALTLRALAYTIPRDGRENQAAYQAGLAKDAIYYGQVRPNLIFNPLAWAEFFEAWKRGDYRRKNQVASQY